MTSETILVLDDNDMVCRAAVRMLSCRGYNVLSASTGAEALELLAARPVDLLLCDVQLESESGYQIAEEARSRYPKRVLMMSGDSEPARGVCLGKPFSFESLTLGVRLVLDDTFKKITNSPPEGR